MKKLILSAAIVLGSVSAFAQQTKVETKKAKTTTTEQTATKQEPIAVAATAEMAQQNPYTEITVDQVPETIKAALAKAYPGATIDKGYVNEAKEYKIEITNGEQKGSLMADANGKWLEK